LPLARELKATGRCKVVYIGLKGDKLEGLQKQYQAFDQVSTVPAGKFRRYHGESFLAHLTDVKTIALNFRDFFRVIAGILASRRILKKLKPDVVFSKGGYVTVPVGIAAHWRHIPIVTHDSDATSGLANRIVGRWADIHATGMPVENYSYPKDLVRYVGIPIDERIKPVSKAAQADFKRQLGFLADDLVLLVAGGGLGAKSLNEKLVSIASSLFEASPKLRIIHLTGTKHEEEVATNYASNIGSELLKRVKVIGFTDEFYKYSGAADLVVTRAGATAMAEFAAQNKACIVVPSPFLAGGHQLKNAEALSRSGLAEVVPNDAKPEVLKTVIISLLSSRTKRESLAKKLGDTAHNDAAQKLAKILLEVAEQGDHSRRGQ
jgi:UDP-N-acetylglucosamine--N-acetylmuramyl-(pentapeptide) pyrophosphoryl-undecaprenol N-acetylglucosamine transferase